MIEDLLQRNRTLESSKRKWKVVALVLASVLLGVILTITVVVFQLRQQAMRAAEEARMQEAIARANAEAARQIIEAHKGRAP
jgi:uncharacterized protein YpmS